MSKYTPLAPHQRDQLAAVEPSRDEALTYFPCRVTLHDGTGADRVYLVDARQFVRVWGPTASDPHKRFVNLADVAAVEESPSRLPAWAANELYAAWESGMGYHIFTLVFGDGTRQAYLTGNAVDFVDYPDGKSQADVARVLPHVGRDDPQRLQGPDYAWCLFGRSDTAI